MRKINQDKFQISYVRKEKAAQVHCMRYAIHDWGLVAEELYD